MHKMIFLLFLLGSAGCTSYGPMFATGHPLPKDRKMGQSCRSWVLHKTLPFAWGRNDIMEAATQGNIQEIAVVDKSTLSYLLYGTECTLVYGR
ncbi:MAG: TRL-like family protein [Bdellovibrionales bacterium]|nr:TRL-like family protein [Bdellovibrionales bacterium]